MTINKNQVLEALSHVEDPDLKKDLVTLNMIRDLVIEDNRIAFSVYLTTPACPMKEMLENACRTAIAHFISADINVDIKMTSDVIIGKRKSEVMPNVKNIIAVGSGKGGVGKSTISAGIAALLSQSGAKVGLMDADIYGPSIPILFGVEDAIIEMDVVDGKELMRPINVEGIQLFSIGFLSKPNEAVVWRGPMVSSALKQFMNGVNWGELDYLIIDLPPGTGDVQLTLVQNLPLTGAVIVSTPQKMAVADARRACAMFKIAGVDVPIMGLVENMSYFTPPDAPEKKYEIFGSGGVDLLSTEFEVPVIGRLPIQMSIVADSDQGKILNSGNIRIFAEIAGKLVQQIAIESIK
ncbi:MAG: Mrp/NBP35 family ATP-binding protein [Bacteroidia bacterium]|nr:Mrp/NBP35 family ATP-binding protein [Bacteroidia bacterium]